MNKTLQRISTALALTFSASLSAQYVSDVWVSDQGDGTFKNPVLYADYSDPDICRVGDDFYMTSSSFNCAPGLPILHSKDLVNWKIIGYALEEIFPVDHFKTPQHGNGVWAPSIRYHNDEFYIYWGDPDFGIYMVKTKDPAGSWEDPVLVQSGKGLIDACPLWDDDGNAYLVHAFAGSRASIKSVLVVNKMSADGTKLLDKGTLVFDGHEEHPTVEGPKFYKHNGYYWIFAPAGGVSTGWQLALRSKNPLGPYEEKIVMNQGNTSINGPHQGGWVELESGEYWFMHFQDVDAYGRIVHLQPMQWKKGWPVIGEDKNGDGIGEPVATYKKPNVKGKHGIETPVETDEFNNGDLGLQWEWHANPEGYHGFLFPKKGVLRFYATELISEEKNTLWKVPSLLLQKFPAPEFTASTKVEVNFNPKVKGERTGLVVMGEDYANIAIESTADGNFITLNTCKRARTGGVEKSVRIAKAESNNYFFKVEVREGGNCQFYYSKNGTDYTKAGETFVAKPGRWIGAKVGLFATTKEVINDSGYGDYDWFRITKNKK